MLDGADARIIALIAPAGCGKTTLARQWVTSRDLAHAWYSVGPEGFDVAAVAAHIAAAVATVLPGAEERMLTRLSVSTNPEAEAVLLAGFLAREMASWPADTRLVIDDYQALAVSPPCERFVETLVRETPIRLLVASRNRPDWASSRLRLYGELFEIGREELQMTPEEARDVLAPVANEEQRSQLVVLCHGWPAVLGLAARARGPAPPRDVLLDGLYDYFAEELFQSASPELQRLLCQISAAPFLTRNLLERLGGSAALDLAATAERDGFFHRTDEKSEQSLHPLLRAFLEHRLAERPDRVQLVDDLAQALLENDRWDDVWQLIQDCDRPDLLPRLIESSLPTLLDGSRLPALESWIAFGHERSVISPLLDLAEAEVSFLAGDPSRAYALALQATHHFDDSSPARWRADAIAARSAYFSDRLEVSRRHIQKALSIASTSDAFHHCLWAEFLCAFELEDDDCGQIYQRLTQCHDGRTETLVRTAQASLLLFEFVDWPTVDLSSIESARLLLDRAHPQVRTGFLMKYSESLIRFARYSDADSVLSELWSLLHDYDLSFGVPVAYCGRAANAIGLRRYRHAELLLDAAERTAIAETDSTKTMIGLYRDVLALLKGEIRVDANTSLPAHTPKHGIGLSTSVNALIFACQGDLKAAIANASKATETTRNSETHAIAALVRAIVLIQSASPRAMRELSSALALVNRYRQWNAFVWAYRAYPELLDRVASVPALTNQIQPVLLAAHDARLAERSGITLPPHQPNGLSSVGLSRRESEILQLVADGHSNKEVAHKLFISDVTVKVHLRHIYEKLGVRNRTEAALHAIYPD